MNYEPVMASAHLVYVTTNEPEHVTNPCGEIHLTPLWIRQCRYMEPKYILLGRIMGATIEDLNEAGGIPPALVDIERCYYVPTNN